MMKKEKLKIKNERENAITLIALVITIIILLILVGITISQLAGEGIIDKAKEAKEKWQNAQNEEEISISKDVNEIDKYIGSSRDSELNYSDEEQLIGKWFGENLYQRTLKFDTNIARDNGYKTTETYTYIKEMVEMRGFGYNSDYYYISDLPIHYTADHKLYFLNRTYVSNITKVYVTIVYTKN